jgi:hypothetical protein
MNVLMLEHEAEYALNSVEYIENCLTCNWYKDRARYRYSTCENVSTTAVIAGKAVGI